MIEIFTQVWTIRVAGADSWGTIVMWQRQRKVGCSCIQENWLTTTRAYPQPKARDILWYLSWIRKPTRCVGTGQMNRFCPLCEKTTTSYPFLDKTNSKIYFQTFDVLVATCAARKIAAWSKLLFYPVHYRCYVSNECRICCNWHWQILNNTPEAFITGCEYHSYE